MTDHQKKRWGMNFINGAYAVAVALLFVLLLRTIAVQITPPPDRLTEAYPDVSTQALCQEQGGRWIENSQTVKEGRPVAAPIAGDDGQGYCQGPLEFERQRQAQEEDSRQTSLFVFAIGGALAVAASLLMKDMRGLPAGFMLGGIFSFFVAGTQLWLLSPGIGRLITMVLVFVFVVGVGWYVFREQDKK